MIMDMQIGVLCGVFSIIASVIVYAVLSFYSIKEDSFDEARANRRKLIKEYMDQSRSNFDKTKQKKTKKNIKKVKDKKPDVLDEDLEDQKENNNHDSLKEQTKEILQNKKIEPVNIVKNMVKSKISNIVEKEVENPVSNILNETNLKKVTDKKSKVKSLEKPSEPEASVEPVLRDNDKKIKIEVKVEKKKQTDISGVRKVNRTASIEKQVINVNSVLAVIRKAELSRSEIQLLIDTLLNSYEDETSDWLKVKKLDSGRQDSTTKLKKQLLELETSLKNEKQITLSLQGKLKELRTDMASDKNNVSLLKETINRMQQEKDDLITDKSDLSSKLKSISLEKEELQEQLSQEIVKVKHLQKQDDDRHHEAISALKKQISSLSSQLECTEKDNVSLKSNIEVLEEELNYHKNCQARINDFEQTIDMMKAKIKGYEHELKDAKQCIISLNTVVEEVKSENQALNIEREHLTGQLSLYCVEIQKLKEEIDAKSLKLAEVKKNGDVSESYDNQHDPLQCDYLLNEKEALLKHLNIELDKKTESLNELSQELKKVNSENKKLSTYVEEALKENSTLKANQISELEETISQLKKNICENNSELLSLKVDIEKYKERNNELRNKNWKLVEALKEREKVLENKLKSEETFQNKLNFEEVENGGQCHKAVDEIKNNVNTFIHRLFPNIEMQEHRGQFNDWLRSVEDAVNASNSKYCSEDLQLQNTQLQSLVAHYKTIISDTEDMLYRLQNHIEVEESKWKEEMGNLQKELESLRSLHGNSV
ncbi:kinectin [Halyomorpha halys]|uniref:kinectin n=1 Tax=Halyomorpha halys TaxID=286706 RepID=UPI0006D4E18E|nr:kinectin [Halyomorpha halys]